MSGLSIAILQFSGKQFLSILALLLTAAILIALLMTSRKPPQLDNVHPDLLEMAAAQPDTMVRIMVQNTAVSPDLIAMIIRLDGQIIRKSNTIDSISLWLPAGAVPKLAQQESVGWISLDGVVQSDSADNESVPNMFEGTPAGVTD